MTAVADAPPPVGAEAEPSGATASPSALEAFRWWGPTWFALGALIGSGRLGDNSFLTHLATGRLILDGGVPHTDPYSFTAHGADWVVQSWGASVLYAGAEALAGPGAIRLLVALAAGLLAAGVWRLAGAVPAAVPRMALTGAVVCAGIGWWNERPQTLAALALVGSLLVVVERRHVAWLVPLFALWTAVHGSWVLGVGLVGLVALGAAAERPLRRATAASVAAALGAVLGAVASPYGLELLVFPFRLLSKSSQLAAFREWQRAGLTDVGTLLVAALVVAAVVGVARTRSWRWLPLVAVAVGLSWQAQRNLPVAALALVPAAVPFLATLGGDRASAPSPRSALAGACVGVLAALGVAVTGPHVDLTPYPTALVDELDTRGWVASGDVRVVAPDWVGNYLGWRFGADAAVFIDDRAEVFPEEVHDDHLTLLRDRAGWAEVLERWDVDVVLWPVDGPLAERLAGDPDWREAGRSDGFVAMCRLGQLDGC